MPRRDGQLKAAVLSRPEKWGQSRAIAASGARMGKMPDMTARAQYKAESWQKLSWQWFDIIGEFRYSCEWVGNLLSKAILRPQYQGLTTTEDATVQVQLDKINAALTKLFGGVNNHPEMLRQLGIHFTAAGECLMFMTTDEDWFIAASSESTQEVSGDWNVATEKFHDALVVRLWRPHPRLRNFPDAPARAVLPILAELHGLTQHVAAQIESRLAGAGILVLPKEISFGSVPVQKPADGEVEVESAQETGNQAEQFVRLMIQTFSMAMANRDSAEAAVPIVLQVEGEYVDKIRHITFSTPLDEKAIELRQEAIRRLALGMDMPPEVLEGTADVNHWSSWQIEEAAIKAHTEPLLNVILTAIVDGFIHPYLVEELDVNPDDLADYSVFADTTKMRLRPNRSKEALELNDRGLLSDEATIRENGFDPTDMMDDKGRVIWLLRKMAGGSTTPEVVLAAAEQLGVVLKIIPELEAPTRITKSEKVDGDGNPIEDDTQEARPTPSLKDHPTRNPPTPATGADATAAAMHAGSSILVFRALERAGNRMRTMLGGAKIGQFSAAETYMGVSIPELDTKLDKLLEDAWGPIEMFAGVWGVDEGWLTEKLDSFTRDLIRSQNPFDPRKLAGVLAGELAEVA